MVTASASNLYYFHPFVKDEHIYISGANLAQIPAMFTALSIMEQKNLQPGDLRVVSIEALRQKPEFIDEDASLNDWVKRLDTLNQ